MEKEKESFMSRCHRNPKVYEAVMGKPEPVSGVCTVLFPNASLLMSAPEFVFKPSSNAYNTAKTYTQ